MSLVRSTVVTTLTVLAVLAVILFVADLLATPGETDRQLCRAAPDAASCRVR